MTKKELISDLQDIPEDAELWINRCGHNLNISWKSVSGTKGFMGLLLSPFSFDPEICPPIKKCNCSCP